MQAFRDLSDFVLQKMPGNKLDSDFNPLDVFEGAVVYVYVRQMELFFREYHPNITHRYILITHGQDPSAPREFAPYLDDPKIIAWLARNPSLQGHPKLIPIPIGLEIRNRGNEIQVTKSVKKIRDLSLKKKHLLYLNVNVKTCPEERQRVYELFEGQPFAFSCDRKPFEGYLKDLKRSTFTLSPRGKGLDCFRTWEALLLGSIPIVKSSPLDPLFADLPVLIVQEWEEITEDFLHEKYREISAKTYSLEKLTISYWKRLIHGLISTL